VCFNRKLQWIAESFNFKAVLVIFCMWSFTESSISEPCCCFVQEFYNSAVMAWNLEENSQTVSELQQFTNSNKMDMSSFFSSQSESPNVFEKKPPNVFDEKTIHLVIHNSNRMSLTTINGFCEYVSWWQCMPLNWIMKHVQAALERLVKCWSS
jgi:hypothetical protein